MIKKTRHGDCAARLYEIWKSMKMRCYNKRNKSYENYGGRGIVVCEEWKHNYPAFKRWAMANGYRDDLTIDRIDNDKGYTIPNCRWIPKSEQSRNRRCCIKLNGMNTKEMADRVGITADGIRARIKRGMSIESALNTPRKDKLDTLKKKAERHGLTANAVSLRMRKGLSLEEALSIPLSHSRRARIFNGKKISEIAKETGININTLNGRLRKGLSIEEAITISFRYRRR